MHSNSADGQRGLAERLRTCDTPASTGRATCLYRRSTVANTKVIYEGMNMSA
jgi:hypothetical protein